MLTIPKRVNTCFQNSIHKLLEQTKNRDDVEILGLFDNKVNSVGNKRQYLLDAAQGEYIAQFDDDDDPAPDYIEELMNALYNNPGIDVVTFDMLYIKNGEIICMYSRHYSYPSTYLFPTRIEIARKTRFLNDNHIVDKYWEIPTGDLIKTRVKIPKILYYYNYNPGNSTQTHTA